MTHVSPADLAGSVAENSAANNRAKTALFCPRCGHESSVDGDWVLTLQPATVEVRCPDCRTLLTTRPHGLAAKERSERSR